MPDPNPIEIGGAPVVTLERPRPSDLDRPAFLSAQVLPGRGMMTLQITAHLPGRGETALLHAPDLEKARAILDPAVEPFEGNHSYAIGGAVLIPYANRIRGVLSEDRRSIETEILGKKVRLPANAGGRNQGAEQYAMHGLMLASRMDDVRRETTGERDRVTATCQAGDFDHQWLSSAEISCENVLTSDAFEIIITARNVGDEPLPMGIGWHPYFELPSGKREQGRLRIPARRRVLVNNYDEVLPTGYVVPLAGSSYDFSIPGGKAAGNFFLDDCFVDLDRSADGNVTAEIIFPEASYGLRVIATSPQIKAIQVYAPPDRNFFVIEPQFNWADPFGRQWGSEDTGMAILAPGESVVYSARLELFRP